MGNAANYMNQGQGHNDQQSFSTCWAGLPFTYKFYFLSSLALNLVALFLPEAFFGFMPIRPEYAWTFFFNFYFQLMPLWGFIGILFSFLMLLQMLPLLVMF